ncbi:MAG TPA: hypothetical protein VMM78_03640, partial [Thermomicrobiales bacterium]|nr:hypothetical protein [Thermomicrobiales bacterium]
MKRTAIVLVSASLLAGGCDLLTDPSPDEARLVIQGEAGKPVRVIISTVFVAQVDENQRTRVVIIEADTMVTTLPYETVYAIDEDQRFFAEAARLDDDLETVHMQVFIDRRMEFDEGGVLLESHPYRFVYTFNQPV